MDSWSSIASDYNPLKAGSIDGTDEIPHDRGIVRALDAKYKPNKNVKGQPECTLFVGRLSPSTNEEAVREAFIDFGPINSIRVVRDIVTGFSKCYAFVEFVEERDAKTALRNTGRLEIDQQEVFVDYEYERSMKGWVPRRLGGGLGGQKESGQLRYGGKDRPFKRPIFMEKGMQRSDNVDRQDRSSHRTHSRHKDRYSSKSRSDDRYERARDRYR